MKKLISFALACSGALCILIAQDARIWVPKEGGALPAIAIPDFRGSGEAQNLMAAFNETLAADVRACGRLRIVPKTSLPTFVPQQPSDFQRPVPPPVATATRGRKKQSPAPAVPTTGGGRWMEDWSRPPAQANYLAFGYTAAQNGVLVLQGWLYDLSKDTPANAQLVGKRYLASVDEAGARKIAHEFAADIITLFGGQSLYGTHIYFTSDRTGHKEIWVMDPDGKNQRQITRFNNISTYPTVSPDGSKIAFTSWVKGQPAIFVFSVDPVRDLRYYNQAASVNQAGSFTPDGKQIVYSSSAGGVCCRIFAASLDGTGFRPISSSSAVEVEPKVNPKTGNDIVFSSGRSGPEQVYRMSMDGADVERLTPGIGEASNASWHPDGQRIVFAWTQGYAAGAFNIFTMNVATKEYVQLTHGDGKNEDPSWAPDGVHIAFAKTRGRYSQVYTMLADGSQLQQLTTLGQNERPVWGR
jgi:TolB protein